MHPLKNIQALEHMNLFLQLKLKGHISTQNSEILERYTSTHKDLKDSHKKTFKKITLDQDNMNQIPEYRKMENISFLASKEVDVDLSHMI